MDILSDNNLMLSVKAGDLDKMGLLFERHHRPLFGFIFHMTSQAAYSEDLVQSVFYRMLKYRHTFKGSGEFKTWMYHLTRNLIKDTFRKNKNLDYRADLSDLEEADQSNNAALLIEKKQETEKLHKALSKLNTEFREAIVLSRFQELSYKEIAKLLETSEGNIKVRVHRAMKELKKIYLK